MASLYRESKQQKLKDDLVSCNNSPNLDSLISLCNRIDICLHSWRHEQTSPSTRYHSFPPSLNHQTLLDFPWAQVSDTPVEPMQLGWSCLMPEEMLWHQAGKCIRCGKKKPFHCFLSRLANRPGSPVTVGVLVGQSKSPSVSKSCFLLSASLCLKVLSLPLQTLLDSGAEENVLG